MDLPTKEGTRPLFIAEAGVNHNGNIDLAKKLIEVAAEAGADAIKFQTFSADSLVAQHTSKAEYQKATTGGSGQYEMLQKYELSRDSHVDLMKYCTKMDIMFLSTPFDQESAEMLADLGVSAIKVSSGDLDNHPLLEHIADLNLPMIVSTGMSTMEEVYSAHDTIRSVNSEVGLVFLHCTSSYPAAVEDVNLRAMQKMDDELSVPVGYSDHTTFTEMPALAIAAGACVVEKHFTIDSTLSGPDHKASLEPDGLGRAVELVELATKALGDNKKVPVEAELENRAIARKSLHAARDIEAGTVLKRSDIKIVRPAEGISPAKYYNTLGKQILHSIPEDKPITKDYLNTDI